MKKFFVILLALVLPAALLLTGCGSKAPDSIGITGGDIMLGEIGETLDLTQRITTEGSEGAELTYSSSDSSVVTVDEQGCITAAGYGSAAVTVSAKADPSVQDTVNLLVWPYQGIYTASKYIDAMGCEIRIRLTLYPDGSFAYYRYPMVVALDGGGQMPWLEDEGSYTAEGAEFRLNGDYLGEYVLTFQLADGEASLTGSVPTGGASTQIKLILNDTDDRGEAGSYTGYGETVQGDLLDYCLALSGGSYELKANGGTISAGSYTFCGDEVEFAAAQGLSFTASYDADRGTVEGTEIPVSADSLDLTAVTLIKEN